MGSGGKRDGAGRPASVPGYKSISKNISLATIEWEELAKLGAPTMSANAYAQKVLREHLAAKRKEQEQN